MSEIDIVKANPEAYRVFASRVQLMRNGDYWIGRCCFHDDNRESLSVFQQDGVWLYKCHAGCGSGNCVQFVAKKDGISISQATKKCKEELAGSWTEGKEQVDRVFKPIGERVYKTFPVSEYARAEKNLIESPEAIKFLESRGITLDTARRLHLGFRQDVGKVAGRGNEDIAAKGWLVFPCFDGEKVVSLKYRSIVRKAFCRQPGMKTCLWNCERVDLFEPIFVTEGELDAMAIEQAGYRAVSIPSASAHLTTEDLDKLASASNVYLAGDQDGEEKNQVGQKAMDRIKVALKAAKMLVWQNGMKDANDVLVKQCNKDAAAFKAELERLVVQAIVSPMPGVYDVALGLANASISKPSENPNRLPFPWQSVDEMVSILPGNVLNVSSSVTGTGKTQWVNQLVLDAAKQTGDVILSYQCENTPEEIYNIVAAHLLQKDRNTLKPEDYHEAAKRMAGVRYYIGKDDNLAQVGPVLDLIENAIQYLGATVVVLDPIHFVCRNAADEIKAQADASQRIKRMAQKYGVKFIVVGHPRKTDQKNRGRVMGIEDWKGSGSGGDDCDAMIVLHRDKMEIDPNNPPKDQLSPIVEVHLLKGRTRGVGGSFTKLLFMGDRCTFGELTNEQEAPSSLF